MLLKLNEKIVAKKNVKMLWGIKKKFLRNYMNGLIGFVRPMSTRNFGLNSKTQTVANPIKQFSTAYAVPREAWGSARLDTIQDFFV